MYPILRLVIVEDDENEVLLLLNELTQGGIQPLYEVVDHAERMRIALQEKEWDLVIADYSLPHFSGLDALAISKEHNVNTPFIMINERLGEEVAVAAMKAGVDDYILKDNLSRLVPAIEQGIKLAQERRLTEDKLRESETRYRSVINAMAEGIVLQDTAGVILACNSNAERILGLTADQMMGRTSVDPRWQAVHEDGSPFPGETHPAMVTLRTGKPCSKVIMGVHKPDQRLTWISINSEPLFRANEVMPYAVVASFSEITEQKGVEHLLRRQNKQLAALHSTTLALIKQLELDELLTEIIRKAAALVNTEHAYLFVLEPEIELLLMRVGIGVFESKIGHQQELGEGLSGEAWRLRASVTVPNYREWSGRLDGLDPLCAVVATPLHIGDKILGFLGLAYLEEGPIFDAEKLNLLEQFAALASVALENAHLYSAARGELVERQRAEATLRQSEEFLQNTLNALSAHIAILDEEGIVLGINEAWKVFAKENGYRGKSYGLGQNYLQPCISARDESAAEALEVAQGIREVMSGRQKTFEYTYSCHSPTERRWFVMRVSSFQTHGKLRVVVSHENITPRMIAQHALVESEERFRQITENMREAFFMVSRNFEEVIYISPAYEAIWQRSCESLYAKPVSWLDSILIEEREGVYKALIRHQEQLDNFNEEYRILRGDNTVRWISARSTPVFNKRLKLYRFVGIAEDITERKLAEEALRKNERRLQHLYSELQAISKAETEEHARRLALLDQMSHQMNLATNEKEIFFLTVVYTSLLIQTEQTSITLLTEAKDCLQVINIHDKEDDLPAGPQCPLAGTIFEKAIQGKCMINTSNEAKRDLNKEEALPSYVFPTMIAPIIMSTEIIGTLNAVRQKKFTQRDEDLLLHLASFLGITIESSRRKKELEKAKEEAEEARLAAESANSAKSTFLANMSHELRTPLNGILGYAQLLGRDNTLTTMQKKGLNIIHKSGEHLLTLINDILDLSKIDADKMELHLAPFHLPDMLKGLVDIFQIRAQEKGINFVYECLANLPIGVYGDEKRLRQVLLNLLSNALKFTKEGEVALTAGMYRGKIRLQVEDTGIGIAPDALAHIFDPFYQATQAANHSGTGLGLAISSKLVEMMGGELHVKSEPGKGSLFWVELELPESGNFITRKTVEQENIIGFKGKPRKVLIVDDNSLNRLLLHNMLAPLGFEIEEGINGEDGLDKAIRFEPDVILVDLRMPVMNGFEMMRRIRDLPIGSDAVMITISASAFDHSRERSLEAGSDEFLAKPFDIFQLLVLLQKHLEIEWLIEPEAPSALEKENSAAPLIPPPREKMVILLDLVRKGNIRRLMVQADKLKQLDQQYHPFASKLRLLAEEIKLKELRELLEDYMK